MLLLANELICNFVRIRSAFNVKLAPLFLAVVFSIWPVLPVFADPSSELGKCRRSQTSSAGFTVTALGCYNSGHGYGGSVEDEVFKGCYAVEDGKIHCGWFILSYDWPSSGTPLTWHFGFTWSSYNAMDPSQDPTGLTGVAEDGIDKQLGCAGTSSEENAGNPCNATTGNKYQSETDYSGGVLTWSRHYNSGAAASDGPLGFGWSFNTNHRLDIEDLDNLEMRRGSGQVLRFSRNAGIWSSDADVDPLLVGNTDGFLVTQSGGALEQYDSEGLLSWQQTPAGLRTHFSYDGNANLTTTSGPYGHTLALAYDTNQRIDTVTDSAGGVIAYSYDSSGNLVTVTYADGSQRSYHYEDTSHIHALTGITDANGARFATWAYNGDGKAILSEHAATSNGIGQEQVTLDYTSDTETTVTNAVGDTELITFSENLGIRNLTSRVFNADGKGISQTFDANNNKTSRTDAEGNTTAYTYNSFNQRTSMTEALGTAQARTTSYTYLSDDLDLPVTVTRDGVTGGQTQVTTTAYDAALNPISISQSGFTASGSPVARQTQFGYDSDGRLISIDGPRSDVSDITTLSYYDCVTGNECGQLAVAANALGHTNSFDSYNAHGQLLQSSDANAIVTNYVYDARQRLSSSNSGGRLTQYGYDAVGQLLLITLPNGGQYSYGYDAAHDLRSITDPVGNRVDYSYDALGNRSSEQVSGPDSTVVATTDTGYDLRSRVNQINQGGSITTVNNDALGNVASQTDPNGNTHSNSYNDLNQLIQSQDPLGGLTGQQFNPAGRVTQMTAANGAVTTYQYDDLGNLTQETSADRGITLYQYDTAGNQTQRTDGGGKVTDATFDALGRMTTETYWRYSSYSLQRSYSYDSGSHALGKLSGISETNASSQYSYDGLGRVTNHTRNIGSLSFALNTSYDNEDRITGYTYPSGLAVSFQRDSAGQVTQVTVDGTPVASSIGWYPLGSPENISFNNGTTESRSFDQRGQVTAIDVTGVFNRSYNHDLAGNITDQNSTAYQYDALHRLTNSDDGTDQQSFNYDANGNRISRTLNGAVDNYQIGNNSNRLESISGANPVNYQYDAAGRITNNSDFLSYQAFGGRFSGYTPGPFFMGDNPDAFSASYNPFGQREKKNIGAWANYHEIQFIYDAAGHLIGEYDDLGALIQEIVYLGDRPIAVKTPAGLYTVHTDHLDTPRAITDSSGTVVWRWESDAFGVGAVDEDPDGDSNSFNFNLRFPGQYFDRESGLHYNWNRYYDPRTGRYITSDPIGLQGGINTFGYASSNPARYFDSSGLAKLPADPSGLGGGWSPDPGHRNPNGEKWDHKSGTSVEWHPGQKGKSGWRGKDHWHVNGDKEHLPPGTDVPGFPDGDESETTDQCGEDSSCRTAATTIVVGGTAYVIYRCIRMIPSMIPPMWATIPANAAIP